jgi:hypothetical protein
MGNEQSAVAVLCNRAGRPVRRFNKVEAGWIENTLVFDAHYCGAPYAAPLGSPWTGCRRCNGRCEPPGCNCLACHELDAHFGMIGSPRSHLPQQRESPTVAGAVGLFVANRALDMILPGAGIAADALAAAQVAGVAQTVVDVAQVAQTINEARDQLGIGPDSPLGQLADAKDRLDIARSLGEDVSKIGEAMRHQSSGGIGAKAPIVAAAGAAASAAALSATAAAAAAEAKRSAEALALKKAVEARRHPPHEHPLLKLNGIRVCNLCRLHGSHTFFNCRTCGYDECEPCFMLRGGPAVEARRHPPHEHPLLKLNGIRVCNLCRLHGSHTFFNCRTCGYDECEPCFVLRGGPARK